MFMGKNVFLQIEGKLIKIPKKGLKKSLHATHSIGRMLRGLL